ncbi:putative MYH7B protein [Trypanosoma conorhini]|uniref:Putative MYH7B protein n=1 Tax=Trypanosoma conorhini TaxID=83891 RepID=A0A422PQW2_9TRYP|nr:putative MYH7B protein [Trypanosoma conorhini]RNF20136.1 putative MYH7B protein [Trypanosoma conorhini]
MVENTTLPEETLRALRRTRSLFLCCRNLFSLSHIRHLEHMTQLSSLNVHMNAISRLECLGHLRQLTELDVSANELRAVDEDAFKGLRHLKRLNLSSNFLTVVNGFQHLPALAWLSLSFNELEDVRGLRRLPCPQQLLHLDICGNKLADLAELEKSLENCRELQDLRVETPKAVLVLPAAPPQLHLRENPFCLTEPNYTERLLRRFQRLGVLNGVTCGCDPAGSQPRRREHAASSGDGDDQLRWHPLDVTSPAFVSPDLPPPRQSAEDVKCDPFSAGVAPASASCAAEDVTCLSTSTTGPSSSDSPCSGDLKREKAEGRTASPPWRLKRVSRSVLTKVSIPLHKELHVSGVEEGVLQEELLAKAELIGHLQLQFQRSQEQLSLRVALEEDLRRSFEELRQSHIALVESTSTEKKRLCRQVTALKEELSRRSEEAVILQRKNRVELEEQTKSLRTALLQQQNESATAMRQLEAEAARLRWESSNEVMGLKTRLDDAVQQTEWLEQQKENAQLQLKKWRDESHSSKTALVACETQLQFVDKSHQLELAESLARRQLEFLAWSGLVTAIAAQLHLLQCENESVVLSRTNTEKAWEEYASSLQQHYRGALLQLQAAKRLSPRGIDVGCDPVAEHLQQRAAGEEEELQRLQTALSLTRQSEQLLSVENERLLRCVADKERELTEASLRLQQSDAGARKMREDLERERDNLLRTLHNLRETVQKKDAEFDELEAEAKQKIDEKRSTIARLEARLEDAEEEAANHRCEAANLRKVQEELQRVSAELQAMQQERVASAAAVAPRPPVTEVMGALEDAKEKLASSAVREHQQSLKLTRAAEALTLLRGQLARVDEDNCRLRRVLDEKVALLHAAEAEKEQLQAQWRETQEAARVRQRATLQAISQMMVSDAERGT